MSIDDQLKIIGDLIQEHKSRLPKEISPSASKAKNPYRALILRGCCLHRIVDLSESLHLLFTNRKLIGGIIIMRQIMETESLFWELIDRLERANTTKDIKEITEFLDQSLVGARAEKAEEAGNKIKAINALTLVKKMGKKFPAYFHAYELFAEFTHPNAAGLTRTYTRLDRQEGKLRFDQEKEIINFTEVLFLLNTTLKTLLKKDEILLDVLKEFTILCEASPCNDLLTY